MSERDARGPEDHDAPNEAKRPACILAAVLLGLVVGRLDHPPAEQDGEQRQRQAEGQDAEIARGARQEQAGKTDAAKAMAEGRVQLEAAIRDKPLAAVAIAALAGFVLAALVRR